MSGYYIVGSHTLIFDDCTDADTDAESSERALMARCGSPGETFPPVLRRSTKICLRNNFDLKSARKVGIYPAAGNGSMQRVAGGRLRSSPSHLSFPDHYLRSAVM